MRKTQLCYSGSIVVLLMNCVHRILKFKITGKVKKMAITPTHIPRHHWNYFLTLEADFATLARYIEPSENNYKAYSLEMVRLLMSACSEIDVVLKQICKKLSTSNGCENIKHYRKTIERQYTLSNKQITLERFGLQTTPWENWKDERSPLWWKAHTDVKHHRDEKYEEANLKNCINALGGLFVAIIYLYKKNDTVELSPPPKLFNLSKPEGGAVLDYASGNTIRYKL